ncbi:zinc finger Y-chromosomal 1-like protein, partial [Clarias magur]
MMGYGFEQDVCEVCARRIQVCWRSHRDRKVFKLLMSTARSAEECLTPAVVRQLSPQEANLLKDQSVQCKVRIRFSGPQFPPVIVFKIFHTGRGGRYLSGKNLFQPTNQATADSCRMMGNRKFMDLMQEDEVHWQGRVISRPADVTCIRDYMQYSSHLDELPAHAGGRENRWRRLNLQVLSRAGGTSTTAGGLLREELSGVTGMRRPDQPVRSPAAPPPSAASTLGPRTPKRRSPQARTLTDRMRRVYTLRGEKTVAVRHFITFCLRSCPSQYCDLTRVLYSNRRQKKQRKQNQDKEDVSDQNSQKDPGAAG